MGEWFPCRGGINNKPCQEKIQGKELWCDNDNCDPFFGDSSIHPSRFVIVEDLKFATDVSALRDCEITHIVSVCPMSSRSLTLTPSLSLLRLVIPVQDHFTVDLKQHFTQAVIWISRALREDEKHKILIHCEMGISRSVTIACAFLLATTNMTTKEALHHIKWKRRVADPNPGFLSQLKEFEEELIVVDNQFIATVFGQKIFSILEIILSFTREPATTLSALPSL